MAEKVKLDLRSVRVYERHPRIFDAWEALEPEGVLEIINNYDPSSLQNNFLGEIKDRYKWDYVAKGPSDWIVNITKLKVPEATGQELWDKVLQGLDDVRPHLQADGGDVELVEIDEEARIARVRLTGACGGCPSAAMTLKSGVEKFVRKRAPEIKKVEPVK